MVSDEVDADELRRFHRHPLTQRLNRDLLLSLERWQSSRTTEKSGNAASGEAAPTDEAVHVQDGVAPAAETLPD
jgi:hypothetical protein